ncbi:hypothetical protein A4D02_05155 [Niastella koreensis]|uniref:TPM domain-containing protein n=2 Tax=Niastella koreensis TaxID=354356 RepID=G8TB31_NIAKG|nr:TPM domain-containing protein [Niastella koreensis]AEW01378.1 protein of unknown function DUF477 [Niastella koreensis GR20-10]OQP48115.1 hypothetical protein A4D02_05155 [Niastella koreensis]
MRYLLTVSLLLYTLFSFSQNKELKSSFVKKLPVPHKAVNDFGRFLISSEKTTLEIELKSYLKQTSNAIVIVTLDSLTDPKTKQEYTVEEAASLYFNAWGIGDSMKNNGVLLLVSRTPRRVRIEIGKGLSAVLDNGFCQYIIDNDLVPNFKNGKFFNGFKEAIIGIENKLASSPAPQAAVEPAAESFTTIAPATNSSWLESMGMGMLQVGEFILGIIVIVALAMFGSMNRFSRGYYSGGGYRRDEYWSSNDDDDRWHNNNDNSSDSSSSFISSSSDASFSSSSSSSSSSDSYSGGSSSGGGASGSW